MKDTDCKGDRICAESGRCVDPDERAKAEPEPASPKDDGEPTAKKTPAEPAAPEPPRSPILDKYATRQEPPLELEEALLESVCKHTPYKLYGNSLDEYELVCARCPFFTGRAQWDMKDGERSSKPRKEFELADIIAGSFTGPGRTEILAEYTGCEAHVTNFGGVLIFRREADEWTPVYISPGSGYFDRCERFEKPDGHHELICESHYKGHGHYSGNVGVYSFVGLDRGTQRKAGYNKLFSFTKNTGACIDSGSELHEGKISQWQLEDADGGPAKLTLTKQTREAVVPAKYETSCDAPIDSREEIFDWTVQEETKTFELRDRPSPEPRGFSEYEDSLASRIAGHGRTIAKLRRQLLEREARRKKEQDRPAPARRSKSSNAAPSPSKYRRAAAELERRLFGSEKNVAEEVVLRRVAGKHGIDQEELRKAYHCRLVKDSNVRGCDKYGY